MQAFVTCTSRAKVTTVLHSDSTVALMLFMLSCVYVWCAGEGIFVLVVKNIMISLFERVYLHKRNFSAFASTCQIRSLFVLFVIVNN